MHKRGWKDWYHCMVSTYGTWLPGDDRGWHERNHHEHVPGDYKNPPKPTKFSKGCWNHSRDIMRHDPFYIPPAHRELIGRWLLESFRHQQISIAAIAVAETNFHALLRYIGPNCKLVLGRAKAHATIQWGNLAENLGLDRRPIWGGGSLPKPIKNEKHGHETFQYILDHKKEGAWTWSHRPIPPQ
ncbi:MAG: hypothetical protein ACTHN5_22080 [Phycisphaerae bacterium]